MRFLFLVIFWLLETARSEPRGPLEFGRLGVAIPSTPSLQKRASSGRDSSSRQSSPKSNAQTRSTPRSRTGSPGADPLPAAVPLQQQQDLETAARRGSILSQQGSNDSPDKALATGLRRSARQRERNNPSVRDQAQPGPSNRASGLVEGQRTGRYRSRRQGERARKDGSSSQQQELGAQQQRRQGQRGRKDRSSSQQRESRPQQQRRQGPSGRIDRSSSQQQGLGIQQQRDQGGRSQQQLFGVPNWRPGPNIPHAGPVGQFPGIYNTPQHDWGASFMPLFAGMPPAAPTPPSQQPGVHIQQPIFPAQYLQPPINPGLHYPPLNMAFLHGSSTIGDPTRNSAAGLPNVLGGQVAAFRNIRPAANQGQAFGQPFVANFGIQQDPREVSVSERLARTHLGGNGAAGQLQQGSLGPGLHIPPTLSRWRPPLRPGGNFPGTSNTPPNAPMRSSRQTPSPNPLQRLDIPSESSGASPRRARDPDPHPLPGVGGPDSLRAQNARNSLEFIRTLPYLDPAYLEEQHEQRQWEQQRQIQQREQQQQQQRQRLIQQGYQRNPQMQLLASNEGEARQWARFQGQAPSQVRRQPQAPAPTQPPPAQDPSQPPA